MKKRYTLPSRIDDIISLIQVLAYADNALRTESGLQKDLGVPKSVRSKKWQEVALSHSEFFRYSDSEGYPFSLVSRYTMPLIIDSDTGRQKREPISEELVKQLLNLATILYEQEVNRRETWKSWIPPLIASFIGALIPAFVTLYIAFTIPLTTQHDYQPTPSQTSDLDKIDEAKESFKFCKEDDSTKRITDEERQ